MRDLLGNVRYTFRQFRQTPIFTAAAIVTLALGIGGTTAIFTLMHAVMLRSLPVSDPPPLTGSEKATTLVESGPQDRWGMFSFPLIETLKAQTPESKKSPRFRPAVPVTAYDARATKPRQSPCPPNTSPVITSKLWEWAHLPAGC